MGNIGDTLRSNNSVSTRQERIAMLARNNPAMVFTTLHHYIDYDWLVRAYELTRKDGAVGVDGQTSREYAEQLNSNLESLLTRMKTGQYKAPSVKRVYIPKADGTQRPLGIASFEDKVAQRAIVMLLEPLFEQNFKNCSFGFRPGRSTHQALEHLRHQIMGNRGRWIIDIDIRKYFDTIDKSKLRELLDIKVKDGVVRKLIDKWLKAGILEGGKIHYTLKGTSQGGVISPLLSNIYLHYAIDEWFTKTVIPRMEGKCSLTRYCDDMVMVFERCNDCWKVFNVLGKRMNKFGLELHTEKTKIIDFRFQRPVHENKHKADTSFNFLGFTHLWKKSRKGAFVVYSRTAKERLSKAIAAVNTYCKFNRHKSMSEQHRKLSLMLKGHYAYFGITGNYKSLDNLAYQVERIWQKWLSRRSRKSNINWQEFQSVLKKYQLPKPRIYHDFQANFEQTL